MRDKCVVPLSAAACGALTRSSPRFSATKSGLIAETRETVLAEGGPHLEAPLFWGYYLMGKSIVLGTCRGRGMRRCSQ